MTVGTHSLSTECQGLFCKSVCEIMKYVCASDLCHDHWDLQAYHILFQMPGCHSSRLRNIPS